MGPLFLCYTGCSTCRKAGRWLDENGINYVSRPIIEENPNLAELQKWILISGLPVRKFFNTTGQVYRELNLKEKLSSMSEQQQIELLSTSGKLIKRPLLITDNTVLVGFNPDEWEKLK